jgi:hypothetical protein
VKGLYSLVFSEENGRTEVTVLSVLSGRTVASATNDSAWSAAVDALTDALLLAGEEVK